MNTLYQLETLAIPKAHSLSKKFCTMICFSKNEQLMSALTGWKGLVRMICFSKNEDRADMFTQWMDFNKIILQTCLSWNSLHQAAYHWQRSHKANWVAQLVPCATWYISIYIYCHNPDLFVFPPLSHHSFCSFQTSCNLLLASSSTSADFSYQLFISTALWHTFKTILSDSHLFFL